MARQQKIELEDDRFYVGLVFYNRILCCFVLIDLKIGKLKHQDLGQMYVNYYDRVVKSKQENKAIGIVLCKTNNKVVAEFTIPKKTRSNFLVGIQINFYQ